MAARVGVHDVCILYRLSMPHHDVSRAHETIRGDRQPRRRQVPLGVWYLLCHLVCVSIFLFRTIICPGTYQHAEKFECHNFPFKE